MELSKVVRVWFLSLLPKKVLAHTWFYIRPDSSQLSPAVAPTTRKRSCLARPHECSTR